MGPASAAEEQRDGGGGEEEVLLRRRLADARAAAAAAAAGSGAVTDADARLAGVLCDLANLRMASPAAGADEEAQALLQEAYALRRGAIEAAGGQAAAAAAAPAGDDDGGGGSNGGAAGDADEWDASDDWEPDVSGLKAATDFAAAAPAGGSSGSSRPRGRGGRGGGGGEDDDDGGGSSASSLAPSLRPAAPRAGAAAGPALAAAARADADADWAATKRAAAPLRRAARELPHVVEFHGLSRAVTTDDLDAYLLDFHYGGAAPRVRWVDAAHALAVFPCAAAAERLLSAPAGRFAVRPYSEASVGAHEHPLEGACVASGGGCGVVLVARHASGRGSISTAVRFLLV